MTFQQLSEFCMVSEYENVTKAAEALFISQPALSMTLKKIENEVGTRLFERRGRYIYLNRNGKKLYRFASEMLESYNVLLEEFRKIEADDNMICIGYSTDYIPDFMIPMFSMNNPNVPISMRKVPKALAGSSLLNETCHLIISDFHADENDQDQIVSFFFTKNQLLVSVPANHPLAGRQSVHFKELRNEKFVRISKTGEFTAQVDALAEKTGVMLKTVQRVNYEVIKALQNNFDFLYFLTSLQAGFDQRPLNRRLIPVKGEMFTKDMYISYLTKNEEKVLPFVQWVKNWFGVRSEDTVEKDS